MAAGAVSAKTSPVASKGAWQKLGVHTFTCPSGAVVKMRIPNLAKLIKSDAIPSDLLEVAVREATGGNVLPSSGGGENGDGGPTINKEMIVKAAEFEDWVVTEALVEPKIERDELDTLPQEDLEMLSQIALRVRFVDAAGVRIGVMPISEMETFRQLHECAEDCPSCAEAVAARSSVDVGRL